MIKSQVSIGGVFFGGCLGIWVAAVPLLVLIARCCCCIPPRLVAAAVLSDTPLLIAAINAPHVILLLASISYCSFNLSDTLRCLVSY